MDRVERRERPFLHRGLLMIFAVLGYFWAEITNWPVYGGLVVLFHYYEAPGFCHYPLFSFVSLFNWSFIWLGVFF